ncbi:MAG: VOC family protein [Hyphomicrobiales bacterium]|nr:VOC family protein [Hyphomicrobiales bacterium]
MTQIRPLAQPVPRRPGELGVHSLDHFNFSVPDLEVARRFYASFGLDVRAQDNALHIHTHSRSHRWGSLTEGPKKKLGFVSFGAFEDDMPGFRKRLDAMRVTRIDPPAGVESNGIWFRDPDGTAIEIRVAEKTSPNETSPFDGSSCPPGVAGAPSGATKPFVRPKRLAHMLIFTRDIPQSIRFYSETLGLRLSDRSGDNVAFLHGIHGSDHHMLAFVKAGGPGLHHLSWDVPSINEIGLGAKQMADKGYVAGWGLGRHVLGSNYFHYVRDPWGSYAEYSSDIDYIPADHDWKAGDHPPEDSFYVWGPEPPPDFAFNHEIVD